MLHDHSLDWRPLAMSPVAYVRRSIKRLWCRKQQSVKPTKSGEDRPARPINHFEIQRLRTALGMAPLINRERDGSRHPNHLYAWETERIMCRYVHNPENIYPNPESFPVGRTSDLRASHFIRPILYPHAWRDVEACDLCGRPCCFFASTQSGAAKHGTHLVNPEAQEKSAAKRRLLQTLYPNGIEEYDTFLQCAACHRRACPHCCRLCTHPLCRSPICTDCNPRSRSSFTRCERTYSSQQRPWRCAQGLRPTQCRPQSGCGDAGCDGRRPPFRMVGVSVWCAMCGCPIGCTSVRQKPSSDSQLPPLQCWKMPSYKGMNDEK